jgi:predicted DNA-binding transcriptional regulator AlpA
MKDIIHIQGEPRHRGDYVCSWLGISRWTLERMTTPPDNEWPSPIRLGRSKYYDLAAIEARIALTQET